MSVKCSSIDVLGIHIAFHKIFAMTYIADTQMKGLNKIIFSLLSN